MKGASQPSNVIELAQLAAKFERLVLDQNENSSDSEKANLVSIEELQEMFILLSDTYSMLGSNA